MTDTIAPENTTLLTCEQVAARLNCTVDYVYRLVRRDEIAHIRFSRKMIRFEEEEIERYIRNHRSSRSLIQRRGQDRAQSDPAE